MAKGFSGGRPGGMGGGVNANMIKQAQRMQQEMMAMQEELQSREYSASAGGGMVTAVYTGSHELKSITINPEAVDPEDVEMLQDMIVAAINEAARAAENDAGESMSKITGGMNLGF